MEIERTHERLKEIWREVLGTDPCHSDETFIELGGDSLSALHCVSRIRSLFGVDIGVTDLFGPYATVQAITQLVAEKMAGESVKLDAPSRHNNTHASTLGIPATINQEKRLLIEESKRQRGEAADPFNIAMVVTLAGPLDTTVLQFCLNEIVIRHEMLRSSFRPTTTLSPGERQRRVRFFRRTGVVIPGMYCYDILPAEAVTLSMCSLEGTTSSERVDAVRKRLNSITNASDSMSVPNINATLMRFSDTEHVLVLIVPHLVCDVVSMQIIRRDLEHLYFGISTKSEVVPLPAKGYFSDFATLQGEFLRGPEAVPAIQYWSTQWLEYEAARPQASHLVKTAERDSSLSTELGPNIATLDEHNTAALRRFARDSSVTVFALLLATLSVVLSRLFSSDKVAIWVNFANRTNPYFDNVVGWFVNSHLIGVDLVHDPTFRTLIADTGRAVIDATKYQGLPTNYLWSVLGKSAEPEDASVLLDFRIVSQSSSSPSPLNSSEFPLSDVMIKTPRPRALHIVVSDDGSCLETIMQFDRRLFDDFTAAKICKDWSAVTLGAAESPDLRLSEQPALRSYEVTAI